MTLGGRGLNLHPGRRWLLATLLACSTSTAPLTPEPPSTTSATTSTTTVPVTWSVAEAKSAPPPVPTSLPHDRPAWLGQVPLPLGPDGTAQVLPTPPELEDRRLATPDYLPAPVGDQFEAAISEVPPEVAARSTWREECPVGLEDLRYLTVSFVGFDGLFHTGELIVAAVYAEDVVGVFARLHETRFPLEEVRVISVEDRERPPTGDGNVTTGFVCRPVVFGESWSEHSFGRAIDINPFHNPYRKGDRVLPELATAYLDRDHVRPGMVMAGDVVTQAFADIGWGWGGSWRTADDWMHFSATGR
ncbi:MAG TPA: M15 family metallopeptidase [Acidimicrobiia bacterium]|nr:M15 family metallopeptidase [Acidimicrobiia bacterium]